MKLVTKYIALTCFAALLGVSAPFIGTSYQTSCAASGAPAVTGNASCFANPTGLATNSYGPEFGIPYLAATANVTSSIGGSGYSDVHAIQTATLGVAWAPSNSIYSSAVSASSNAQFGANLTTAGPVRQGLLQIVLTNKSLGYPPDGSGWGTFNLMLPGLQSTGCGISWSPCASASYVNHFDALGGFVVPLGTSFFLTYNGAFEANAGGFADGNGSGTLDLDYQFRFLEADGFTPVAVLSAAPEPATFGILALSLAGALAWKRYCSQEPRPRYR